MNTQTFTQSFWMDFVILHKWIDSSLGGILSLIKLLRGFFSLQLKRTNKDMRHHGRLCLKCFVVFKNGSVWLSGSRGASLWILNRLRLSPCFPLDKPFFSQTFESEQPFFRLWCPITLLEPYLSLPSASISVSSFFRSACFTLNCLSPATARSRLHSKIKRNL